MITYNDSVFHLTAGNMSYVFYIKDGKPVHLYWGKAISDGDLRYTDVYFPGSGFLSGEEIMRMEFPTYGTGDFRNPMIEIEFENSALTTVELVGSQGIGEGGFAYDCLSNSDYL